MSKFVTCLLALTIFQTSQLHAGCNGHVSYARPAGYTAYYYHPHARMTTCAPVVRPPARIPSHPSPQPQPKNIRQPSKAQPQPSQQETTTTPTKKAPSVPSTAAKAPVETTPEVNTPQPELATLAVSVEPPKADIPRFQPGDKIDVRFEYGQDAPGTVVLLAGQVRLNVEPLRWQASGVRFELPGWMVPPEPIQIMVFIKRPDGVTVRRFPIILDSPFGPQKVDSSYIQVTKVSD